MTNVVIEENPTITVNVQDQPAVNATIEENPEVDATIEQSPEVSADGTDDISLNSLNRYLSDEVTLDDVKAGNPILFSQNQFINAESSTSQDVDFIYSVTGELERMNYENGEYKIFQYTDSYLTRLSLYDINDAILNEKTFTYSNGVLIRIDEV